jgi:glucosamine-6-phosphate deaminase
MPHLLLGIDNVPRKAITMGIGTVRRAKELYFLHGGLSKTEILKTQLKEKTHLKCNIFAGHNNTTFVLDRDASSELTRVKHLG